MSAFTLASVLRSTRIVLLMAICNDVFAAEEELSTDSTAFDQRSQSSESTASASLSAREVRGATAMRPVSDEAPAKIVIDPPLPELLARGMALIQFRTENLRLYPVFGPAALSVSPRIGHLYVRLDDSPWAWAHTSGDDLIVNRLLPGPHKIQIELSNANHQILAKGVVQFEVPEGPHRTTSPSEHEVIPDLYAKGQPPAKIHVDPPPTDRLARGTAFLQCRIENSRIAAIFGPEALEVSPRIGHLHVTVDDARWRWADTTGGPVILAGLPPGPHKVLIELVNANHKPIASSVVDFEVPQTSHENPDRQASGE